MSDFDIEADSPEGFCIRDMQNGSKYFFYDQNSQRTNTCIVLAADHNEKTLTLAGYSFPNDAPVVNPAAAAYYYYADGAMHYGEKAAGDTCLAASGNWQWEDGSWYVVTGDIAINRRVEINGTVNLILADGATLIAKKGVAVNGAATLNIYGQNAGTGRLIAGLDGTAVTCGEENAAIGGSNGSRLGTLNIHGGNVVARSKTGAAIGGGADGDTGVIAVYGGSVDAENTQGYGAAIGCGYGGNYNGASYTADVTILGGTVTGYCSWWTQQGAGIGKSSYWRSAQGTLTLADGAAVVAGDNAESAVEETDYANTRQRYVKIVAQELPYTTYTVTWVNHNGDVLETDAVESLIDAIGEVAYTDACKAKIDAARAAYDALTGARKALVENYPALTAAEARYAALKAAAEAPEEPVTPDDPEEPAEEKTCPLCGATHNKGTLDRLVGVIHRLIDLIRSLFSGTAVCG